MSTSAAALVEIGPSSSNNGSQCFYINLLHKELNDWIERGNESSVPSLINDLFVNYMLIETLVSNSAVIVGMKDCSHYLVFIAVRDWQYLSHVDGVIKKKKKKIIYI